VSTGHVGVGRLGARSNADLAWESELLQHLDREGLTVPVPIPTTDGRLFADGLVVMTYVEGGPPETEADWRRVADTLRISTALATASSGSSTGSNNVVRWRRVTTGSPPTTLPSFNSRQSGCGCGLMSPRLV
jgi:hypothetical protein